MAVYTNQRSPVKKKFKKEDEEEKCVIVSDNEVCEIDLRYAYKYYART